MLSVASIKKARCDFFFIWLSFVGHIIDFYTKNYSFMFVIYCYYDELIFHRLNVMLSLFGTKDFRDKAILWNYPRWMKNPCAEVKLEWLWIFCLKCSNDIQKKSVWFIFYTWINSHICCFRLKRKKKCSGVDRQTCANLWLTMHNNDPKTTKNRFDDLFVISLWNWITIYWLYNCYDFFCIFFFFQFFLLFFCCQWKVWIKIRRCEMR